MNRVLILSALLLASCGTNAKPAPEPVVQIVEVKVPVAVACDPDIGPEPAYVDTPEAIAAAPDIFARTVLLVAGRVQRIARDEVKTAALEECRRPPATPPARNAATTGLDYHGVALKRAAPQGLTRFVEKHLGAVVPSSVILLDDVCILGQKLQLLDEISDGHERDHITNSASGLCSAVEAAPGDRGGLSIFLGRPAELAPERFCGTLISRCRFIRCVEEPQMNVSTFMLDLRAEPTVLQIDTLVPHLVDPVHSLIPHVFLLGADAKISSSVDQISAIAPRMGRPKVNHDLMPGRFPEGTFARIDAVRREGENRSDFLKAAVEAEIKRREGLKQ